MKYWYKILLFNALLCTSAFFYVRYLEIREVIPHFSMSMSFDAKLWHLYQKKPTKVDVLAVGSSLTFYNLNTDVLLNHLNPKYSYYNFASWQFSSQDLKECWPFLSKNINPKVVILLDYQSLYTEAINSREKDLPHPWELSLFYNNIYKGYSYLKTLNYCNMIDRSKSIYEKYTDSRERFDNLNFDANGGTFIDSPFDRNEKPFTHRSFAMDESLYESLEQVCLTLQNENSKLIYVNFPYRPSDLKTGLAAEVEKHTKRVRAIVNRYQHLFVEDSTFALHDSLYYNSGHLNKHGAEIFTKCFLNKINLDSILEEKMP